MTLHLVTASPLSSRALERCLSQTGDNDAIVLLEDGVYAMSSTQWLDELTALAQPVYILESDRIARGLTTAPDGIQSLQMAAMVELTLEHQNVLTWT